MRKLPLLCWKYVLLSTTDRLWLCHAIMQICLLIGTCETLFFHTGCVLETQKAQPLTSSVVHGKTTLGPAGKPSDGGNFYA